MKDVRTSLAIAYRKLKEIAKNYDLKADLLPREDLERLINDIGAVTEDLQEAERRSAGHIVTVLYAIGKESSSGHCEGFTHGPTPDRTDMLELGENTNQLDQGDVLVRITRAGGEVTYAIEAGFLDGEWVSMDDEPTTVSGVEALSA